MYLSIPEFGDDSVELEALHRRATQKYGFVPDAVRVLMTRPEVASVLMDLKDVLLGDASTLGKRRADLIAVVVSAWNRCEYCHTAHAGMLAESGEASMYEIDVLSRDWRSADLDEAERTMLAFVEKLSFQPPEVDAADIRKLRDDGFTDANIYDIVLLTAYRHLINRVHDGLGAPLGRLRDRFGNALNTSADPARDDPS